MLKGSIHYSGLRTESARFVSLLALYVSLVLHLRGRIHEEDLSRRHEPSPILSICRHE